MDYNEDLRVGDTRQTITTPRGMDIESPEKTLNITKYMLTTDLPPDILNEFSRYVLLISKELSIAYLERRDMPYFDSSFRYITLLLECGMIDYARELMMKLIRDLKLTRSLDGIYLKLGMSGIQQSETVTRIENDKRRRSMGNRIASTFRRSDK